MDPPTPEPRLDRGVRLFDEGSPGECDTTKLEDVAAPYDRTGMGPPFGGVRATWGGRLLNSEQLAWLM